MKVLSDDQRKRVFLKRGILIPKGSRCCIHHLLNGFLDYESLYTIEGLFSEWLVFDSEGITNLIDDFRLITQKFKTFSFDDPNCLSDEAYYYLTGLEKGTYTNCINKQ